ncbi:MAG: S8 family serine peptidase, partial [Methanocellales archaeon]|nr:S8 family serine peptidase [Methanocellales archaeon]
QVNYTDENTTDDLHGHGTHCAGIAAGKKNTTSGVSGVAYGASLLNAKVMNQSGTGLTSWILSGIEWSMNNHADVLSMSFGDWQEDGTGRDPLSMAVANAASQVVVVVAAGNEGPGEATIASPAVAYNATIAVAASDMDDTIASFSSRGPTGDGRVGVDLAAPGVAIIAPRANGTTMGSPIDEYYTSASGTSMSAPHVAGAVALLLQANSTLTPGDVERTLKNSADDISGILEQGAGRLDVYDAYDALTNGTLVDHEWYVGKVYAGDYTKTFTVINKNATANVTLSITKSNMTDTQGNDAGDWMTMSTASLFILNESSASFDVTMSVPSTAVGTYIGNITLVNTTNVPMTNITIPISVNVMQRVDGITIAHMTETLDEDLYTSPKADFPCGDWVYYTLDVQAGVANLNLSLDWTYPNNDIDLVLFNTTGECTKSYLDKPETISVKSPEAGKWTVAIWAYNLTTAPETYSLTVIGSWSNTSLWHMTSKKAHTDHSWWYGIEENNTYNTGTANSGTLTSGPIDLRGMTSPKLRFYTWWETEQGTTWDKKIVQISTDGGANWQELMQVSEDNVIMGAWHLVEIDLSGYVDNVIMIRFYFDTVDSILNDYWGWFIDDIVVEEPIVGITSCHPVETYITNAEGEPRYFNITITQTVNVSWWIDNNEVQTNTSVTFAEYTNQSAVCGRWIVSAIAENPNGTAVQRWYWDVIPPSGYIAGWVNDTAGNPVADAWVDAWNETTWAWGCNQTDINGYYNFSIQVGTYDMWVWPPYGANLSSTHISGIVVTEDATTTVNFTLEQAAWIAGKVKYVNETGIAGASISAWNETTWAYRWAMTDVNGSYLITGLATNTTYDMYVWPPYDSGLLCNYTRDVYVGTNATIDFILSPGHSLSGYVTVDGVPVEGAWVNVWNETMWAYGWGQTNASGYYKIIGLANGIYEMYVWPPYGSGLPSWSGSVTVEGDTIQNIQLGAGVFIHGKVMYDNTPVEGAWVSAWNESTWAWGYDQTDDRGYYIISGLVNGTYDMYVWPPYESNLVSKYTPGVIVKGDTEKNFVLSKGYSVSGNVASGGKVVDGAWVCIWNSKMKQGGCDMTDAGYYEIYGLSNGTYNVEVWKEGYMTFTGNVTVAGNTTKNIVLSTGGYTISGNVTKGGVGLKGADVFAWNETAGYGHAITDATGFYQITNLANATYDVTAWEPAPGNATASITVVIEGADNTTASIAF